MAQLHPFMHVAVISSMMFHFFLLSTPYRLTHMWAVLSSSCRTECVYSLIEWFRKCTKRYSTMARFGFDFQDESTVPVMEARARAVRWEITLLYRVHIDEKCATSSEIFLFFPFAIIPSESFVASESKLSFFSSTCRARRPKKHAYNRHESHRHWAQLSILSSLYTWQNRKAQRHSTEEIHSDNSEKKVKEFPSKNTSLSLEFDSN